MQVDLPALERPTKAISGTSSAGKKCSCGAVVRNFAVCSQPVAMTAGALLPAIAAPVAALAVATVERSGAAAGVAGGFVVVVIGIEDSLHNFSRSVSARSRAVHFSRSGLHELAMPHAGDPQVKPGAPL